MEKQPGKRKRFFANEMHRQIFLPVMWMSALPMVFSGIFIVLLIFNVVGKELNIPEAIIYNCYSTGVEVAKSTVGGTSSGICVIYTKKLLSALAVATPLALILLMVLVYRITHRIVGPFDRLVKELGENISGERKGPIIIRENDKFAPLVEKINELLARSGSKEG